MYGNDSFDRSVRRERLEQVARDSGPTAPKHANAEVTVGDVHRPVVGRVLANPGEVVLAERRAGDDPEAVVREPRDREVALDARRAG